MKGKDLPVIRRGRTEIDLGRVNFVSPAFGPNTYLESGKQVLASGLQFPVGEDTADLLYAAYCVPEVENEPEFQDVRNKMKHNWLWVGVRKLWTPKGVYAVRDPTAIGRSKPLKVNVLERALKSGRELSWGGIRFSRDGGVGFAPKGSYKLGDHTPEELAKDGDVIASYGEKEAEQLAEVSASKEFKYSPITWGLDIQEGQEPEQRVSAVDGYDDRLGVDGSWDGGDDGSCAFGVCPSEKRE